MILCFELTMPGVGSRDGKRSGKEKQYLKLVAFRGKKREDQARKILVKGYYIYNFGDGWRAAISVRHIGKTFPKNEPSRLRRESAGFCGYDWMVDSIIDHNDIIVPTKPVWRTFEGAKK